MSHTNDILLLLNIQDKFITLPENPVEKVADHNGNYHIEVSLKHSKKPKRCDCCKKHSDFVVKDHKTSKIKWLTSSGVRTIIKLTKTRWKCKLCNATTTPNPSFLNRRNSIANTVKHNIALKLADPYSFTSIAKSFGVSVNTVIRIMQSYYNARRHIFAKKLPEVLLFDEFKSTKYSKHNMSFIYLDGDGNLIDVVETRTLYRLRSYFHHYTLENRKRVRFISIDMYGPYVTLIKEMFPNAVIVYDKFHVVKHVTTACNKTRIRVMNLLDRKLREYKSLKYNWNLILLNRNKLDFKYYRPYRVLNNEQHTQTSFVDKIVSVDSELSATYELYQYLLNALQTNNIDAFDKALIFIEESLDCSPELKKAINIFKTDYEYVTNSMKYPYNTGKVESKINLIKQLKRNAFGFKSFFNYKLRILVRFNVIPIRKS